MIIFGKSLLGETSSQSLVCPVYDDLFFEMKQTRSLKHYLEEKIDFSLHKKEIRFRGMDIGDFYRYSLPEGVNAPFSSIYYIMIRSFLKKPYFFLLKNSLESILLDVVETNIKSFSIPLFGLDCFKIETELEIIRDAIFSAYKINPAIKNLQLYILGIPRELFNTATQIFSKLPKILYSQEFRPSRERVRYPVREDN